MGRLRKRQPPPPFHLSPLYPHTSGAGKTSQGRTDKINLLKDQIVPVDRGGEKKKKTKCEAEAIVGRNQSEIESRAERLRERWKDSMWV